MKTILFLSSISISAGFWNMEGPTGGFISLGLCGFVSVFIYWAAKTTRVI